MKRGRLEGKVGLVFGAGSSGTAMSNGRAIAVTLAAEGAAVCAIDRHAEQAELTARRIAESGGRAMAWRANVTNDADVRAAVEASCAELGPPDVLVNDVGLATVSPLAELSPHAWDEALSVNVGGVFLTCRHVVPAMVEAGGGAVVNVSSVASLRHTGYDYPAYMAAKAAVNQLTVSVAVAFADRGVRANAVLPA